MDWYPLWNSLRIALISCTAVFFLGIFAAYYIAKLPRAVKGVLDVVLTLPMVLPPTVVGYFLLLLFGAKRPLGACFIMDRVSSSVTSGRSSKKSLTFSGAWAP